MCVREKEREREGNTGCVCVCVRERERERAYIAFILLINIFAAAAWHMSQFSLFVARVKRNQEY